MTPLSSIRLLICLDLGQKGLPSSIITPILQILDLADEEMRTVGYDFEDPRIDVAVEELERAITGINIVIPHAYNLKNSGVVEHEQLNNFGNVIELGWTEEKKADPLSYLDDDDGN